MGLRGQKAHGHDAQAQGQDPRWRSSRSPMAVDRSSGLSPSVSGLPRSIPVARPPEGGETRLQGLTAAGPLPIYTGFPSIHSRFVS
ncbi:MAG: hypothetical protein JG774_670 [Desulfomicrobiaceae bacterium]|jgi:hypothetical protein|nr:hypothetical protein [Desulfomicrobiaceae bacterium]